MPMNTDSLNTLSSDWRYRATAPKPYQGRTVTAQTLTLVPTDIHGCIQTTAGAAVTVTVPTGLPDGASVDILQAGAGQVTFVAGSGMTLHTASSLSARAQWSVVSVFVRTSTDAVVFGDLT